MEIKEEYGEDYCVENDDEPESDDEDEDENH